MENAESIKVVLKDDTELFKQFMDNEAFRKWLTGMVFDLTYMPATATDVARS